MFYLFFTVLLYGFGIYLIVTNYGAPVDDYESYRAIFTRDSFDFAQPVFSFLFPLLGFMSYEAARAVLGFISVSLMFLALNRAYSRYWIVGLPVIFWYLESLLVVHLRMGVGLGLAMVLFTMKRAGANQMLFFLPALTHYASILPLLLRKVFFGGRRVGAGAFILGSVLIGSFDHLLLYFDQVDLFKVYLLAEDFNMFSLYSSFLLIYLILSIQGRYYAQILLFLVLLLNIKLFAGHELGGRLSSALVISWSLMTLFPAFFRNTYSRMR